MYAEWKNGSHGNNRLKCSSSGCHDPHTPGTIFGGSLLPFVGNGFNATVLPQTQLFMPLAGPPVTPPTDTPLYMIILTVVAVSASGLLAFALIRGGLQR
jgi:hypothetical protein